MLDMLQTRLSDLAAWHGVIPVANEVLERHIDAELRKNRGSWWYHHERLANFCMRGGLLTSAVATGLSLWSCAFCLFAGQYTAARWSALLTVLFFLVGWTIMRTGAMSLRGLDIKGPAQWIESDEDPRYVMAPAPILDVAMRLMRENTTGDMHLIKGRLMQNHITIDPYLVIRRGDDQIVLGIWDDHGIIHQATVA